MLHCMLPNRVLQHTVNLFPYLFLKRQVRDVKTILTSTFTWKQIKSTQNVVDEMVLDNMGAQPAGTWSVVRQHRGAIASYCTKHPVTSTPLESANSRKHRRISHQLGSKAAITTLETIRLQITTMKRSRPALHKTQYSTTLISCGFVVQLLVHRVVQQIRHNSHWMELGPKGRQFTAAILWWSYQVVTATSSTVRLGPALDGFITPRQRWIFHRIIYTP